MPAAKPKVTDFTGRERERLIKENAEAIKARAQEMAIITAEEAERASRQVTDYTDVQPTVIDSIEDVGVSMNEEWEVVQVLEDLEQVTIGAGNNMDFKAGQKYKVTKHVADHLREKGYVYS